MTIPPFTPGAPDGSEVPKNNGAWQPTSNPSGSDNFDPRYGQFGSDGGFGQNDSGAGYGQFGAPGNANPYGQYGAGQQGAPTAGGYQGGDYGNYGNYDQNGGYAAPGNYAGAGGYAATGGFGASNPATYGQYGDASDAPSVKSLNPGWRSVIPMHPLSIGETIDAAIRVVRYNPVAYILFPLLVYIVSGVAIAGIMRAVGDSSFIGNALDGTTTVALSDISILVTVVISVVTSMMILMAGTRVTIATVKGQKLSLKDAFGMSVKRMPIMLLRFFGLAIILGIIFFVAMGIFGVLFLAMFSAAWETTSQGVGIVMLVIVPIVAMTGAAFILAPFVATPTAIVAEDIGPFKAISRSFSLSKGSLGYIVGLLVTVGFIGVILMLAFVLLVSLVGGVAVTNTNGELAAQTSAVLSAITGLLSTVILTPVLTALINLIYVNLRMRRENFHLDFAA